MNPGTRNRNTSDRLFLKRPWLFLIAFFAALTVLFTAGDEEVFAAAEVTVGKASFNSVTREDSISLGTVDLSTIDPNEDSHTLTYQIGIRF